MRLRELLPTSIRNSIGSASFPFTTVKFGDHLMLGLFRSSAFGSLALPKSQPNRQATG